MRPYFCLAFVKMLESTKIMDRITVTKGGHDVCKLPPMHKMYLLFFCTVDNTFDETKP